MLLAWFCAGGLSGLTKAAITVAPGTVSRSTPSRLVSISEVKSARDIAAGAVQTGNDPKPDRIRASVNTIGIVDVAAFAARIVTAPPVETRTAALRPTSSAAIAGKRSYCPSAQRNSIVKCCPSTWPVSRKPSWNAATKCCQGASDPLPRKPIIGRDAGCACTASGHAAVKPATTIMKSRRRIHPVHTGGRSVVWVRAFQHALTTNEISENSR
jgi:hypothetical protein